MNIGSFKNYLTIALLFFFASIYGQNIISGNVVDSANNPIEFANIILIESTNNAVKYGAVSNEKGEFVLKLEEKGTFKLVVSFIGYKDFKKDLDFSESINIDDIILLESNTSLKEVTITSSKEFITKKEDKIILNIKNSPLKAGYNGIEVLQRSPYVWVDSSDNILMRNEAATILINGRKSNLSSSDLSSYLSGINSESIKSIEITTNKGANLDGESTGGVINIILSKGVLGFNATVKTYNFFKGKNYNKHYLGSVFNYGANKWNVYGSYNYSKNYTGTKIDTDIFYNETYNFIQTKRLSESTLPKHNYQLGLVSEIWTNHELGLELFGSTNRRASGVFGNLTITNNNDLLDSGTVNVTNNANSNVVNGILNYKWKIKGNDETFTVFVDYTNQQNTDKNINFSNYNLGLFDDNLETNNADTDTKVYSFQGDYKKKYNKGLKLETGIKHTISNRFNGLLSKFLEEDSFIVDEERTTLFKYNEGITGGYFSLDKNLSSKQYLKLGLRIENTAIERFDLLDDNNRIKQNYTNLFPSAYYSYNFSKSKSLSTSYSRSIRRPSFNLLNNTIIKVNDFRFLIGNPDLEPELVDKVEISYQFNKQTVSAYYNEVNDAINGVYFLIDDIAYYQKKNAGSQIQYGLEYNRSNKINSWWYLRFTGNLFYRKFVDEQGNDQFGKATIYLNTFNNFKLSNTLDLDIIGRYNSAKTDAFYEAAEKYSVNLVVKKSFLDKKLNARLYINDVFNSLQYINVRQFDNYVTRDFTKPRTRTVGLWLTYNFTNNVKASKKRNKSKNDVKNRF
ncbi:TonB-dependent receptor domain-containing protein [Lacinutrix sp. Bg11-31]|uniref:TonB-dependent receptor domain-containing protein n=1 Tax=Lacinutrix sp. Bg11-31 TaxID=2057808 RepID=UPI0018E289B0|nr:outer membrane beta-barrel family protein [Lacinutrix sp. Bg11-31]